MKLQTYQKAHKILKGYLIFMSLLLLSLTHLSAQSEKELDARDNQETQESEFRMKFEIFKINDKVNLRADLKKNDGKKFQPLPGSAITFYKGEVMEANIVGRDTSDTHGIAMIYLNIDSSQVEDITYIAVMGNNPDITESADLLPSYMDLEISEIDSIKTATVMIGKPGDDGITVPLADKECKLYIKRLFGLMPLSEESITTDEEGIASFEIPEGIKGDHEGNITMVAKLTEDEELGNVEVSKTMPWGTPLADDDFYSKRELWSARSNAPISLIVIVNLMLILIWGCMIYVALNIFKINKLGKTI